MSGQLSAFCGQLGEYVTLSDTFSFLLQHVQLHIVDAVLDGDSTGRGGVSSDPGVAIVESGRAGQSAVFSVH